MSGEPINPATYDDPPVWPDDAALEAGGYAAGLDVWGQVTKAYENYLEDAALANAQLWSLREAIRGQQRAELG